MARDIPSVRSLEISFLKKNLFPQLYMFNEGYHSPFGLCVFIVLQRLRWISAGLGYLLWRRTNENTCVDTAVCTTVAGTDQKCSLVRMMIKGQRRSLGVEQCDMPLSAIISELALWEEFQDQGGGYPLHVFCAYTLTSKLGQLVVFTMVCNSWHVNSLRLTSTTKLQGFAPIQTQALKPAWF